MKTVQAAHCCWFGHDYRWELIDLHLHDASGVEYVALSAQEGVCQRCGYRKVEKL